MDEGSKGATRTGEQLHQWPKSGYYGKRMTALVA